MATSLAGWMKYLSGPVPGQPDAAAQDFLSRLQQYDPSAHFEVARGGGDDPGASGFRVVYNQAALPKSVNGQAPYRELNAQGELPGGYILDRSKIYDDPVYGKWIGSDNTREAKTAVDRWGPIAVGALAGAGGLGLLGEGAAGAAGAGSGFGDFAAASQDPAFLGAAEGGSSLYTPEGISNLTLGDIGGGGGGALGEGGYSPGSEYGSTFNPDGTIPQGAPGFDQAGAVGTGGPGDGIGGGLPASFGETGELGGITSSSTGPAAGAAGGIGSMGTLGDLMKTLGGIPGIASIIGSIASGVMGKNATDKATDQVLAGIEKARGDITGVMGNNQALYKPYTDAGPTGIDALTKMLGKSGLAGDFAPIANKSLAGNYKPLGAGRAFTAPQITLGQMMGRK